MSGYIFDGGWQYRTIQIDTKYEISEIALIVKKVLTATSSDMAPGPFVVAPVNGTQKFLEIFCR